MREALDAYLASNSTDVPAEEVGWRARPLCATGHFARPATLPADAPRARGAAGGPAPRGGGGDRGRAPRAAGRGQRAFLAPRTLPEAQTISFFSFAVFNCLMQKSTNAAPTRARWRAGTRGPTRRLRGRSSPTQRSRRRRTSTFHQPRTSSRTRRVMARPPSLPISRPNISRPTAPPTSPGPPCALQPRRFKLCLTGPLRNGTAQWTRTGPRFTCMGCVARPPLPPPPPALPY